MQGAAINIVQLKDALTAHGVKPTSQRLIIYEVLLQSHEHPTAEDIYGKIRHTNPSISLGTVYKTLDTLVAAGLAKRVKTADDVFHFDAKTHTHSHLYCTKTNRILDFEDDELNNLLEEYFKRKKLPNFRVADFQVHINGELINDKKK